MSFLRSISSKVSAYSGASPPPSSTQTPRPDGSFASPESSLPQLTLTPAMGIEGGRENEREGGNRGVCMRNSPSHAMKQGASEPVGFAGSQTKETSPDGVGMEARSAPAGSHLSDFGEGARAKSMKRAANATMTYRDLWLQP
mmetsp:Transcript_7503/g.15966  ORF Transcript_7503/g.15966 Transcript_7503/m.15966 type:complete len:142 (+) Transcript_7503:71-496(+)